MVKNKNTSTPYPLPSPFLVTNPYNIQYLTNFRGSFGFLLLTKKQNYFFTDARYSEVVSSLEEGRIPYEFILVDAGWKEKIHEITKNFKSLHFEARHLTVASLEMYKKVIRKSKFIATENAVEDIRLIKNETEIIKLKRAQKIIDEVFAEVKNSLKVGKTEREIAWEITSLCHTFAAEGVSFEPIVGFAEHSASPHHSNTDRKLRKGDVVLIDHGAKYDGYCSDMTRMIFTKKPTKKEAQVYSCVLTAQNEAISALKAGIQARKPDAIARKVISNAGFGENFTHSLGHGVGLEVHDGHVNLSQNCTKTLKKNMVVTVEPGIYLPGEFGVRIEDMGRITADGYENFTASEKTLESCVHLL